LASGLESGGDTGGLQAHATRAAPHLRLVQGAIRSQPPFQLKEWLGHARFDTASIYVQMAKQNAKKVMEATSL